MFVPPVFKADSYKAAHFQMYPPCQKMVCYGEFRAPMAGMQTLNQQDQRIVFYGMRHCIETHVSQQWTHSDIDMAKYFFSAHNVKNTSYPFPEDLFRSFVNENNGYFPVKIQALPEGSVVQARTPVFIITAENKYARLCTYLESVMTMVWYPSCVATLSRFTKKLVEEGFETSVDEDMFFLKESRLHDFGLRGCTCIEQAVLGGSAHLLSFNGSDNLAAAYHVQFKLNNGNPVAMSVPASEHSVMTAFQDEQSAVEHLVELYGDSMFSVVMDSYDYDNALATILPAVADVVAKKGGTIVIRPDSGDPVEQVMKGLHAAAKNFPVFVNKKGYTVVCGCAVLQGDGIDYGIIQKIQKRVLYEGFAVSCVVYGMGGSLLQKVNRDTMSFATKLCYISGLDHVGRDVMKSPKGVISKCSLPGELFVGRSLTTGQVRVYDKHETRSDDIVDAMRVVYDSGPVEGAFDNFGTVQERLNREWDVIAPHGDPMSTVLRLKIQNLLHQRGHKIS